LFERTAGADVIGGFVDQAVEDGVAWQSEEEVDAADQTNQIQQRHVNRYRPTRP
jgi:hypothetical protein